MVDVVGGVVALGLIDDRRRLRVAVGVAGAEARHPGSDVGLRIGAGGRDVALGATGYERLAKGLAGPRRSLGGGVDAGGEGHLLDSHRRAVGRGRGDGVGQGVPVGREATRRPSGSMTRSRSAASSNDWPPP